MLAASSTIMDLKLVNNLEKRKDLRNSKVGNSVTRTIYHCKISNVMHNGHQNAEIMHFRSEKVGSVRQFQLFLLIMHYLETTKPTVQVDIPF